LAEALIIVVLMLLPLLYWWRLWTPDLADRAVIPEGDFTSQYYPLQLLAARELAAGRLPAWDPYINAGQPGLADPQTGTFYPLNLIPNLVLALLRIPYSLGVLTAQVIFHFSLASLFTYLFVRHLARRAGARLSAARFAGAIAALTFTYAGYLTSFPVQQITILETAVWLPLVLLFVDRAFHSPRPAPQIVSAAVALACALLAGHPQTAMYLVYATLAYGLFLAWSMRSTQSAVPNSQCLKRAAYCLLPILLLGAALAAVKLVPTVEFIARSTRAGLNYDAVAWGFPLAELTHLLYPGYFGGSPQYVGILPLILAAAAWFVKRARRQVAFWYVFGAVALFLSFGGHTFLYNVFYLLVPGFGAVRDQERVVYLFSFTVSVLAGYGSLALVQPLTRPARRGFQRFERGLRWVGAVFLTLTALFYFGFLQGVQQGVELNMFEGLLRHHNFLLLILGGSVALFALRRCGRVKRPWLAALALGLVWLNLFTINWRFNLSEPVEGGPFPQTGLAAFLQEEPGTFRVSSAGLLPGGASAGIVYELEDLTGNTPLRLDALQAFKDQVGTWRQWQLLNVQYVLRQRDLDAAGLEVVYEEGEVKVYRLGDPLPRAWVVHETVIATDDEVFDLLNAEDFDPLKTAVLAPDSAVDQLPEEQSPGSLAQVVEAVPGRLTLEVSPGADGLLVVSQAHYPGWQARVDGVRAPIYRVDYLLQGVPVEAGSRVVELTYRLSPWPAAVSLVALAVCMAVLVLGRRRANRPDPPRTGPSRTGSGRA
jgi:hypothetical protein